MARKKLDEAVQVDLEDAIRQANATATLEEQLTREVTRYRGQAYETPDPVPFQPTVKMVRGMGLKDQVQQYVRSEAMRMIAEQSGHETFQEANDFDVDDDYFDPTTPYEDVFDGVIQQDEPEDERVVSALSKALGRFFPEREPGTPPDPSAPPNGAVGGGKGGEKSPHNET